MPGHVASKLARAAHAIGGPCASGLCKIPARPDGLATYDPNLPETWSMWADPSKAEPTTHGLTKTPATFLDHTKIPIESFNDNWEVISVPEHGYKGKTTWKMYRDTPDMIAGVATVPPGREFEKHWHAHAESYFSVSGGMETRTGEDVYSKFNKGDALRIPSMAMHHTTNASQSNVQFAYFIGDFRYRQGPDTVGWAESLYQRPDKYETFRDTRDHMQPQVITRGTGVKCEFRVPGAKAPFEFETFQDDREVSFGRGFLPAGGTLPAHFRPASTILVPLAGRATATSAGTKAELHAEASTHIPAGSELSITAGPDEALDFLVFTSKCGVKGAGQARWLDTDGLDVD